MAFQGTYAINPPPGMLGELALPNAPHTIIRGVFKHATGGQTRLARPGDALFWNTTDDGWTLPNSAANSLITAGILTYPQTGVGNASSILEYDDDDEIEIGIEGVFWLEAKSAIEPLALVEWDRTTFDWATKTLPAAIANIPTRYIEALGAESIAADALFLGRIAGRGR